MKPDIFIEMTFNVKDESTTIRTNAKHDKVDELLTDYLHSIVGAGKDETLMVERDVYTITIGVELADDSWGSSHDCGNKGLRDGIIMRVLALLSKEPSKISFVD